MVAMTRRDTQQELATNPSDLWDNDHASVHHVKIRGEGRHSHLAKGLVYGSGPFAFPHLPADFTLTGRRADANTVRDAHGGARAHRRNFPIGNPRELAGSGGMTDFQGVDMSDRTCSIADCTRAHHAHGLCNKHYLVSGKRRKRVIVGTAERFWAKVSKSESCWEWTANLNPDGYGTFSINNGKVGAHRVSYEMNVGPIPEGMQIDHLCRNRKCVRPDHLEPVTSRENTLRGISVAAQNAVKTHCKRGHEYTAATAIISKTGGRRCRVCKQAEDREYNGTRRSTERTS